MEEDRNKCIFVDVWCVCESMWIEFAVSTQILSEIEINNWNGLPFVLFCNETKRNDDGINILDAHEIYLI